MHVSHIDKYVANGIKARIALYTGDYQTAHDAAKIAVANASIDYDTNFRYNDATHKSVLWGAEVIEAQGTTNPQFLAHMDIAFGGYPYSKDWLINNPKNFYIKFSEWYGRLFDDPAFVAKVKERFAVYYAHRQDIIDHIDATCRLLADKVPLDNHIWGCLCSKTASAERVKSTYAKEVEELKNWLLKRMDWLHENLEKL